MLGWVPMIWNRHVRQRAFCMLEDPIGFWDPLGRAVHWCQLSTRSVMMAWQA